MNSLQIELNTINEKLELLTYRKNQLEAVMDEYSDVVNRVKSLIETMQDANVEPSNLLMEIESLIYCPEQEPTSELTPIESYLNELPSETSEPTPEPFSFDLRLFPKPSPQPTPENLQAETLESIQDNTCSGYKLPNDYINTNTGVCNRYNLDTVSNTAVTDVKNAEATEPAQGEPLTDDDDHCDTDGLEDVDYGFDDDDDDDEKPIPTTHRTPPGSKYFLPMTYWDYEKSVRMFIGKKSRSKEELEAIISDCLCQELAEKYEINECGKDWIVTLSPVTNEVTVNQIIGNFYPSLATPEPTPEPVKLMTMVPAVAVPNPTPKTQLNERAWRRDEDRLLIGFDNKKLMAQWYKWVKESWGDRVHVDDLENLDGFKYCLSILWHGSADWERLSKLDYSLKPTEQKRIETDNFEYKQATETTIQIFRDGVLLGLAKDCDSHWESPQLRDEQFDSRDAVAVKLWELINQF